MIRLSDNYNIWSLICSIFLKLMYKNGKLMSRVMKTKLKVSLGMHLAHYSRLVGETNQSGYGKYYHIMSLNVFLCCKDIHRMLKWSNGIRQWIFCFHVAMTIPLRYCECKIRKLAMFRIFKHLLILVKLSACLWQLVSLLSV